MTLQLKDAADTLRIFTQALGHTPEIDTTTWDKFNLIQAAVDHAGYYIVASIHRRSAINDIDIMMIDTTNRRAILKVTTRPEFALDIVKQTINRYPVKQVAA